MTTEQKLNAIDEEIKELKTLRNEIEKLQPGYIEVWNDKSDDDPRIVQY